LKIVTVVGTRPHLIKMAPLSRELEKSELEEVIVHAGQHYDYEMNKIFFEQLSIPEPNYLLGVGSGSHGYQTGEMLKKAEEVLNKEKPSLVVVFGDANSTLAGALAAAKLHIKVAHIEAGLRSFDKRMPEEINRILTDHTSSILFAPTKTAVNNLYNEGIKNGVHLTGDILIDALKYNIKIAGKKSKILEELELKPKEYLLATVHRADNTDNKENLERIVDAFIQSEEHVVFPTHPRTLGFLKSYNIYHKLDEAKNILLIKPVDYFSMLVLERNAKKILTDSGGIQKEAYFLKVPCITLRDITEWVETVDDGWNLLVGSDVNRILMGIQEFEPDRDTNSHLFGDGLASKRVIEYLISYNGNY